LRREKKGEPATSSKAIGHALDRFIGTSEQAAELLQASTGMAD
jgi:hypothetical protein